MIIGLDTSVVVRLLVGVPETQFRAARRRIESAYAAGATVLVSDIVIAETFHALRHHYDIPEHAVRTQLTAFLTSGLVTVDPPDAVQALGSDGGAGLVDRLILYRYRERRATTTLTFDRAQARLDGAELVR